MGNAAGATRISARTDQFYFTTLGENIPYSLIENIDKAIENQNVTFSSFVIQACEYASVNMDTASTSKSDSMH